MSAKECWINVYKLPSGELWQGAKANNSRVAAMMSVTATQNGCKLLYRIHVTLK